MKFYVLHLFCDGVLSETRLFKTATDARNARVEELTKVGAGVVDGEVVDVNGSVWSGAIEMVEVEQP